MDNKNSLDEFLNNPFVHRYLEYYESVLCNTVSTLSTICDEMTKKNFKPKPDEVSEIVGYINKQCSGLMRALEFSATLRSFAEDSNYTIVNFKRFLNVFAEKCNSIIGPACYLEFSGEEGFEAEVQKNVISYAMLEFIRSNALKYGKDTHFKISCENRKDSIVIGILVEKPEQENEFPRRPAIKFFEDYFSEINEALSEKSGMKYKCSNNSMTLVIPKNTKFNKLSNESIVDTDERFLKYYTMLEDIINDIDFD